MCVGGGSVRVGGGQGGCEQRIEVFVKIKKKKIGGVGVGRRGGGEVSGWGGVRVDVNEELNFLGKFSKKILGWGPFGGGGGGGGGWGGQGGCE